MNEKEINDNITDPNADNKRLAKVESMEVRQPEAFYTAVRIVCTHYRRGTPDNDNLNAKAAIDAIVKRKILEDDGPKFVESVTHKGVKVKEREEVKTVIEIEEV